MGKKLNVRAEIMELLEENAGINLQDLMFDNGLFIKKKFYLFKQTENPQFTHFFLSPTPYL